MVVEVHVVFQDVPGNGWRGEDEVADADHQRDLVRRAELGERPQEGGGLAE
jgi:hypothetical protein